MGERTVKAVLKADTSQFVASMKQSAKATDDFASKAKKNAADSKAAWEKTGKGMMVAGGIMAVGVGIAVKSFADFDATMSQAQAGTMATGAALKALRAAAIDAGAKTQFSATEAAQAITAMGKAGVSTKDILGGGLTGALNLAAAGQLDVAQASEIAATAMNQFGLEGKDIPHIADLLAAGAGKAMGSVEDLAGALRFAAPTAKGLGISIEETTGTLAMFAQQGIKGEMAGTNLRSMLLTLTSPSGIVAQRMEDLGLNMYDANGAFIGMEGAAGQLQAKLGPLDDATRNAALGQIFGNEAVGAARILYEGGAPAVAKWTAEVNDAGFAAEQAAMLTNNWKGDVERLGGSLSSVLIKSGSGANDMLRTMTTELQGVVDWYGELPAPVQKSAFGFAAVTAGGLLTVGALITVIPKIAETKRAFDAMNITTGKSGAALQGLGKAASIAAALAAVAAAGVAISNSMQDAVPGIEATTAALLAGGQTAEGASKLFADLYEGTTGVQDLASAFDRLTNKSWDDSFNDKVGGFFGEITDATKSAEVFNNIGQSLATLVSSGHADKAKGQFDAMAKKLGLTGDETLKLMKLMPAYGESLSGVQNEAKLAAGKTDTFTTAQADLGTTTKTTKEIIEEEIQLLQDAGMVVLSTRAATRDFAQAQRDATAALKENGKGLKDGTVKGDANAAVLDKMASSALGLADSIFKETGSEEKMRGSLISSRASLVAMGVRFGLTKAQANTYADSIIKIPASKLTKVEIEKAAADAKIAALKANINAIKQGKVPGINANTAAGVAKIRALQAQINALKSKTIRIDTIRTSINRVATGTGGTGGITRAEGGLLSGPGTGTSDSIPLWGSTGEYMVKAAAVSKYGIAHFDDLNSMRFAAGGYVGPQSSGSTTGPSRPAFNVEKMTVVGYSPDDAVRKFGDEVKWQMVG